MLLSNYAAGDQTGLQTMSVITESSWGLILPHPNRVGPGRSGTEQVWTLTNCARRGGTPWGWTLKNDVAFVGRKSK